MFKLIYSPTADAQMDALEANNALRKRCKAAQKTLGYLATNRRHPGLKTHKYHGIHGANGEEMFEAYCENRTPGAYRIFWHYGPGKNVISIIAITPHP